MKLLKAVLLVMNIIGFTSMAFAANQCFVFVSYEGPGLGPEPTRVECGKKASSMKSCMKACKVAAKKACPKNAGSYTGNVNFNSSESGFEVDSFSGECGK